jgi:uncharacterized membrane protein YhaH (DUF805 family)
VTWLRNGLGGLLRFKGRESSRLFWPWAGLAFALAMVAGGVLMAPTMIASFARVERFAAEHPDQVTVTRSTNGVTYTFHEPHPELMPDFDGVILGAGVMAAVLVALLAAAVTRRLHDSGLSGLLGLMPLPFLGVAMSLFPKMMASMMSETPDMTLFAALFANNALYMASLGLLVLLLVRKPTPGPNRYGEPAA